MDYNHEELIEPLELKIDPQSLCFSLKTITTFCILDQLDCQVIMTIPVSMIR